MGCYGLLEKGLGTNIQEYCNWFFGVPNAPYVCKACFSFSSPMERKHDRHAKAIPREPCLWSPLSCRDRLRPRGVRRLASCFFWSS